MTIYLNMDGDGYHSVSKTEDCGIPVFSGEQVRSSGFFPGSLLPPDSTLPGTQMTIPLLGTAYQISYHKPDSVTEVFTFHKDLLKKYTLGPDCLDLDTLMKAYGPWYPDRDNDGYHDAGVIPLVTCQPPSQITYLLIQNSLGPDCDDEQFAYNEVKTWYRDMDGDGFFVDVIESCQDPGSGWSLTATRGPDDNDNNVFSPSGLPGEEEFVLPSLIDEMIGKSGHSLVTYGGVRYYRDSLEIYYRGATFRFADIIYDQVDPDTLLTKQKLVIGKEDILYGAEIRGVIYAPTGTAARQTFTESDTIILNGYGRSPTEWISEIVNQNDGYTHAYGDLRAVSDSATSYFDEVFDQEVFDRNIRDHYDLHGHPPFRIEYKSYEETQLISLEGGPDQTKITPVLNETVGTGDLAVRIEVLKNLYGRIEYVVSINDEVFQATPEELAAQTWKDADGNLIAKTDAAGNWLDPADEQLYLTQLAKIRESRRRMVHALVQDFSRSGSVAPPTDSGEILSPEVYPEYDYGFGGWFTKLTEMYEIGCHLGHEFEMPEGTWNPEAADNEKWRTKSASSVAGIIDRSMQEIADMAEMVELAQSLTKKDTWTQILESLKNFSISKMLDAFITQGQERLAVLQGDSGVYKQHHAVGEVTAGISLMAFNGWKQIQTIGKSLFKSAVNPAKVLKQKKFEGFERVFNPKRKDLDPDSPDWDNFNINTSQQFRKLDADQQKRLTRDLATDESDELRKALAEKPELVDSWRVISDSPHSTDLDFIKFFDNVDVAKARNIVADNSVMRSKFPDMSVEELTTIYHYTTDAYYDLNRALRGLDPMTDQFDAFSKALTKSMDRLPKYSQSTYRGSVLPESIVDNYKKAFNKNGSIVEDGFMSTSKDFNVAKSFADDFPEPGTKKVFFKIEGRNGVDIEDISAYGPSFNPDFSESEILFKSGSRFQVVEYLEKTLPSGESYISVKLVE